MDDIDIGSPEQYVKTNNLQEVTSNNMFSRNSSEPDPEGLVSYTIFGDPSSPQRKTQFAYIDLGDYFVHPSALDTLVYLKKIIKDVVYGEGEFFIRNGNILKVTAKNVPGPKDDVGYGTRWLRNHIKEINFTKDDISATVEDRIRFIKSLSDDEMFTTKWLVIPAFFRDVDVTSNKKNDINIMYQKIIAQAGVIKSTRSMFGKYTVTDSHRKIQDAISALYLYFTGFTLGTKTFMQQHVLGKGVDYAARMVISTPKINCERPEDMEVDFSHSATPLPMVLECFAPFIHYGFREFIKNKVQGSNFLYTKDSKGHLIQKELASNWEICLLSDNVQKLIKLYTDSKEHRLDTFTLEAADGSRIPIGYIAQDSNAFLDDAGALHNVNSRPITLCELFYMVAYNTVRDKQIMVTRYPVEDYFNIYPSYMNIIPFTKTAKRTIDGVEYPRFPVITDADIADSSKENVGEKFVDTLHLFPTYLKALGADFDGDTVSVQGVFTKNTDSENFIYSLTNIINIGGGTCRDTGDITAHTIYALTKGIDD